MKKIIVGIAIVIFLIKGVLVFGQNQREPTPIPTKPSQGNSLLLSQEPKLTHTVKAYWTTVDGLTTEIKVTASGRRPTQIDCNRSSLNGETQIFSTLNPRCNYNIRLSATGNRGDNEKNTTTWKALGDGTVIIRIHGFEKEDYSLGPEVIVKYLRDGKVVGESSTVGVK